MYAIAVSDFHYSNKEVGKII